MTDHLPLPATAAVAVAVLVAGVVSAGSQQPGDPDAGEVVYRQECAMCHGDDATGMMGMHPALRGAADRLGIEGIEVTVRNGRSTNPPMPAFGDRLSDEELADVVAYVAALPEGPRNFGPGGDAMGGGMMGSMSGDGPGWMFPLVVVLTAALAGLVGFVLGRRSGG